MVTIKGDEIRVTGVLTTTRSKPHVTLTSSPRGLHSVALNFDGIEPAAFRAAGGRIPEQVRGPCSAPRRAASLITGGYVLA